ncbi:HNH endonuclease [Rhodococcus hoagii]|nr:HNH endonuclease [Prescottella equi]
MSRRKTGPKQDVVDLVLARCEGVCEICGQARFEQLHHRRARGMGGTRRESTNTASALLALCQPCHALVESQRLEALDAGWLVSQAAEPRNVAVTRRGRTVLLDDFGGTTDQEVPF